MRNKYKYKAFLKYREIPQNVSILKILKFKRPKWFLFKKQLVRMTTKIFLLKNFQKITKKISFFDPFGYKIPTRWAHLRFIYRENLIAKRKLFYYFNLRSKKSYIKNLNSTFLLPRLEFKIDVLLWRIGIFESIAMARFALKNKYILLNGKPLTLSNYIVNYGDMMKVSMLFNFQLQQKIKQIYQMTRNGNNVILLQSTFNIENCPYFIEMNWDTLEFLIFKKPDHVAHSALYPLYSKDLKIQKVETYYK